MYLKCISYSPKHLLKSIRYSLKFFYHSLSSELYEYINPTENQSAQMFILFNTNSVSEYKYILSGKVFHNNILFSNVMYRHTEAHDDDITKNLRVYVVRVCISDKIYLLL